MPRYAGAILKRRCRGFYFPVRRDVLRGILALAGAGYAEHFASLAPRAIMPSNFNIPSMSSIADATARGMEGMRLLA